MPNQETYSDGMRQWDEKNFPQSSHVINDTNYSTTTNQENLNISSCDIKTDVINLSLKIENSTGLLFHVFIKDIISWDIVNGTSINLNTTDEVTTVLLFKTVSDANTASIRIEEIINGADIQLCGDGTEFYAIITEDEKYIKSENNDYWIIE